MKQPLRQEVHHKETVWVNPTTESLRKKECLCLNCGRLKPGQSDNCPYAQTFFDTCVMGNIALMVTRCRGFKHKTAWIYKYRAGTEEVEAGPYATYEDADKASQAHARACPRSKPSEPIEVPADHTVDRGD